MAERSARRTTVYLRPGLTGGQRKAALRRLRQEASRGCGPALPPPQLMVALAADRVREGLQKAAAVVRLHPAGSLLPAVVAGALMALFVLASVSGIAHSPGGPPGSLLAGAGAAGALPPGVLAPAVGPRAGRAGAAIGVGGPGVPGAGGAGKARSRRHRHSAGRSAPSAGFTAGSGGPPPASAAPARTRRATASRSRTASPTATRSGKPSGTGSSPPPPTGSPSPSPSPSPSSAPPLPVLPPSSSLSGDGGGATQICVDVGAVGDCLAL